MADLPCVFSTKGMSGTISTELRRVISKHIVKIKSWLPDWLFKTIFNVG